MLRSPDERGRAPLRDTRFYRPTGIIAPFYVMFPPIFQDTLFAA